MLAFLTLLVFSTGWNEALGVTCNSGSSLNYIGDCGTMGNTTSFTTADCSGSCYTESMKQGISPGGVCDAMFVTAGCVVTGSKDCSTLQAEYDAYDPDAGNFGFACEECSTDSCNPTTPLQSTLSAMASNARSVSLAVAFVFVCISVISLQ